MVGHSSPKRGIQVRILSFPPMGKYTLTTRRQLTSLLSEGLVVQKILGKKKEMTDNLMGINGKIKVLYGETYDSYGITIDSLKYYLFLEYLVRLSGKSIEAVVVEGDLHSVINPSVSEKTALLSEGKRRIGQIRDVFEKLDICQTKVVLMSELFLEKHVEKLVQKTTTLIRESEVLQNKLASTVLSNRVAQEKKSGFRYAAEAIGLALSFDLKVGPPREVNYDEVAQLVAREFGVEKYKAIYLRPSYPFTDDFSYYLTHPEIEKFGLTPYKAGSNKLQNQRIIIGQTSMSEIEKLVIDAYVPVAISDANPLVDMASIVIMSEQIRQNEIDVALLAEEIKKLVSSRNVLLVKILSLIEELA